MSALLARIMETDGVAELRRQWQDNLRFRWLVFGVGVVFLLYLVLVADDIRISAREAFQEIAARELKLTSLSQVGENSFEAFLTQEREAKAALRESFWLASSEGLAGAELQSWLRRVAAIAEMENVRLEVSDVRPIAGMQDPLWRLDAEISGQANSDDARRLIGLIARSKRLVVVEQLSYAPQRGDRLSVQLAAYFLIER